MPNPVMPNGFVPTVAAYSHDGPGGVIRTDVAGGAPRYALDYDRGLQKFNVTLIMDKLKFEVWTLFFTHVIRKGAYTFDMPLDSGFGTQQHACNIMPGSYSATRTAGIAMVVSFVVEAESKAYDYSTGDAVGMIDIYNAYGAGGSALLARLVQFALYDTLALVFPAPVYSGPSLDLDFANQLYRTGDWLPEYPLSSLVTFTRSTTGTRTGPTGLIETVAINAPRIDYDPVTGECKGLLIEEAKTNLLTYSEQFDNAAWTKNSITVTPDAAIAPDGTQTADALVNVGGSSLTHFVDTINIAFTSGTAYTQSVYAKALGTAGYRLRLRFNALAFTAIHYADFDLVSGAITSNTSAVTPTITHVGDGWYRCTATATATATASSDIYMLIISEVSAQSFVADGTSGLYAWRAGLEAGSLPTSSIKTDAAAVTRAVSDGTFAAQNRTVGTIIIEHDAPSGRVLLGDGAATVITSTGPGKIALAFDATGSLLCANGGTVTAGAAVSLGATLRLLGNSTVRANAHIKHYAEHPRKFLAAELQAMTV